MAFVTPHYLEIRELYFLLCRYSRVHNENDIVETVNRLLRSEGRWLDRIVNKSMFAYKGTAEDHIGKAFLGAEAEDTAKMSVLLRSLMGAESYHQKVGSAFFYMAEVTRFLRRTVIACLVGLKEKEELWCKLAVEFGLAYNYGVKLIRVINGRMSPQKFTEIIADIKESVEFIEQELLHRGDPLRTPHSTDTADREY